MFGSWETDSWGVAPGYDEDGLRPMDMVASITLFQSVLSLRWKQLNHYGIVICPVSRLNCGTTVKRLRLAAQAMSES